MGGKCSTEEKEAIASRAVPMSAEQVASYFSGTWYEQARSKRVIFEVGCRNATADYAVQPDGTVKITNACVRVWGQKTSAELTGTRAHPERGVFAVSFKGKKPGGYHIMSNQGGVAVVVGNCWTTAWVLTRSARYDEAVVRAALEPFPELKDTRFVFNAQAEKGQNRRPMKRLGRT